MQINEDMLTPHHYLAADRWIARNGIPETDEQMARMGREVFQEAAQVVETMACKTFEALDAHREDCNTGVETLEGSKGRDFLADIYQELRRRA